MKEERINHNTEEERGLINTEKERINHNTEEEQSTPTEPPTPTSSSNSELSPLPLPSSSPSVPPSSSSAVFSRGLLFFTTRARPLGAVRLQEPNTGASDGLVRLTLEPVALSGDTGVTRAADEAAADVCSPRAGGEEEAESAGSLGTRSISCAYASDLRVSAGEEDAAVAGDAGSGDGATGRGRLEAARPGTWDVSS